MPAVQGRAGMRGFDCNRPLTVGTAATFRTHGYEFVNRYVSRTPPNHSYDLSAAEIDVIRHAGLQLGVVQHVESADSWEPSIDKGASFGAWAARASSLLGVTSGANVFCDLEGVNPAVPESVVIDYLKAWYSPVLAAGYRPALYVGWHCGVSTDALYRRLGFATYWAAYNLNGDQEPAVRGCCMRQHARKPSDVPPGIDFEFDVNTVAPDHLGGLPWFDNLAAVVA